MNPVNIHSIDPNTRPAVQLIQNPQSNNKPQEIQLPDESLHSDDMQNNVPPDKGDCVNKKASGPGTIQIDGKSHTLEEINQCLKEVSNLMQIKV